MAAGKFMVYTTAMKYILQGNIDLDNDTIVAIPLHDGYTPSTASHSALAQLSNFQSTASSTVVNGITLTSVNVTGSGAETVKFDAADLAGFSSDGDTFQVKYVALYSQSASVGGVDKQVINTQTKISLNSLDRQRRLYQAMHALPLQHRELLNLALLPECDFEDMARILKCPVTNVKLAVFQAKAEFKKNLLSVGVAQ